MVFTVNKRYCSYANFPIIKDGAISMLSFFDECIVVFQVKCQFCNPNVGPLLNTFA